MKPLIWAALAKTIPNVKVPSCLVCPTVAILVYKYIFCLLNPANLCVCGGGYCDITRITENISERIKITRSTTPGSKYNSRRKESVHGLYADTCVLYVLYNFIFATKTKHLHLQTKTPRKERRGNDPHEEYKYIFRTYIHRSTMFAGVREHLFGVATPRGIGHHPR